MARGTKKWVFKNDTCSFYYTEKDGKRLIIPGTIEAVDKDGELVERGDRRTKQTQRSTPARMPGSRREQRD